MAGKYVGYARVSTKEQNLDRQLQQLKDAGCEKVYFDKTTGTTFKRQEYQKMKQFLREGDTLFVLDLSRLGRNKAQIKQELTYLMDHHIDFVCLNMGILDTRRFHDMPDMERLVFNLIIEIVAHFAEEEWKQRQEAQRQGIEHAKAAGKYQGRPTAYSPHGTKRAAYYAIRQMLQEGLSLRTISSNTGAGLSTVQRIKREEEKTHHAN